MPAVAALAVRGDAGDNLGMVANSERSLLALIRDVTAGLPAEQVADMQDLVVAGEPGIAFENLCTQLDEYEISVSAETITELRRLGGMMGISQRYWEGLAVG